MDNIGEHWTADLYLATWPGDDAIMAACEQAIAASNMTVVATTYKRFAPHGVTAAWILQESHFTLHTYPEHGYLSVDCYTCGREGQPGRAIETLLAGLDVSRSAVRSYARGDVPK